MGAARPLISVVLPTWNTREDTLDFLESLARQDYPRAALEVLIADNGSGDGSQDAIRRWYAQHAAESWHRLELIELPENRGIAAGYNAAYERCSPEALAILRAESDVLFAPDLVTALVEDLLALPDAGVVGARGVIHGSPGRIDHAARYVSWWTGSFRELDPAALVDCDCVFGGTFLVRRSCIERMGSFFQRNRFLASELELCTRVKRLGYRVLCEPRAVAQHKVARSSGHLDHVKFAYISHREQTLFHLAYNRFPRKAVFLAFTLAWSAKRALAGEGMFLRGFLDGLSLGCLHRPVRLPGTASAAGLTLAEWLALPQHRATD